MQTYHKFAANVCAHIVAALLHYVREKFGFSVKARQIFAAPAPEAKPQAHPIEMRR
ncbi:MAG TPA: hypothetical protein PKC65_13370 [Pyrinomonadaceae bacterium]|nr:hypothetical protein [Pyrinomonadaceae bacterium]